MKDLNLPGPIAAYFKADGQGAEAVAQCFTPDGLVHDEGKSHAGQAAIAAWKTDSSARYSYEATPQKLERMGDSYLVTACIVGDFPGSPLDLRYRFDLERSRIARLEIAS